MGEYVIAKYIRLSLDDAISDSMSIENQRLLLDAHIAELGIPNVTVIERVDNGCSGVDFERPGIQELLELVRAGRVNCIAVKDFSRFGRNAIETGYFIERVFPLFGVRFISVTDGYDSDNYVGDTGGLEVSFHFLKHEYYSRDLSMKIRSARRIRQQRGESVRADCLFGYKLGEKRRMVIDEAASDTVRLIFDLALRGSSIAQIAKRLYEEKCPTPSEYKRRVENPSCVWSIGAIHTLLREEQYTGMYIAGRTRAGDIGSGKTIKVPESEWIKIPNHHPAIIEKSLFDAVRVIIDTKNKPRRKRVIGAAPRYKSVDNPLKGKVVCGCCGHAMTLSNTANPRWKCRFTRVAPNADCYGLSIAARELAETLFEIIRKQAQVILNADISDGLNEIDLRLERQSEYARRIEGVGDEKRTLYERFILGELDAEDFKSEKISLDAELARLTRIHDALAAENSKLAEAKSADVKLRKVAESAAGESALTRALADLLIDRVRVFPGGGIEVEWRFADYFSGESV
jgi:DNA invertase Pin-like site-specific DNA recombinase